MFVFVAVGYMGLELRNQVRAGDINLGVIGGA
jgi:hypothetical protein